MRGSLLILLSGCLLAACAQANQVTTAETQPGFIQIYFTDPETPEAAKVRGGPDEPLAAAIDDARLSVDVAIYNLDLYDIRDSLVAANERGVPVRLVIEQDYAENDAFQKLQAAGIPVVTDKNSDYMHDKFVVIDRYEVWTGSMNYTVGDVYGDRNNLVAIKSTRLAQNYETEFNEMFLQRRFGPSSPADTPYPNLDLNGILVETYFSPEDGTLAHLLGLVNEAKESVYFLAYSFTSDELSDALITAAARGVDVRGVFDAGQVASNTGGEYDRLRAAGINVRLDGEEGSLHDKVLIVDGDIVVTGSYNFSKNAETGNDENTLVIHSEEVAKLFIEEFERIWGLAE